MCAAALLTGCAGKVPDTPSFSFSKSGSESFSSSSTSLSEKTAVSDGSETEQSGASGSHGTDKPVSDPSEKRIQVFTNDPENEKTVEFNGMSVTVSGKMRGAPLDRIFVSVDGVRSDFTSDENSFTAEIALTEAFEGTVCVELLRTDRRYDELVLNVTADGFVPWELSEIAVNNAKAAKNALTQPQNQVAEYIVKGGDPDEIRKVLGEIRALSDEICEGLDSEYDKLRAISEWVAANIYYDYPAYDNGVPEETLSLKYMLERHSSVCGGYSNMTSALCAAQGIRCLNVHGSVLTGGRIFVNDDDGEYHEWNIAEIDGRVIWVDSGWNSFCYLSRDGDYINNGTYYRYFDIGEEYLALNHKANYAEYRDYFALM